MASFAVHLHDVPPPEPDVEDDKDAKKSEDDPRTASHKKSVR